MILVIRTDKPEAEIGLFEQKNQMAYETWHAHRQLAETIHTKIQKLLDGQGTTWSELTGIVVFQGPGSFTGLRIGMSVANALAYGLSIPVAAGNGHDWQKQGISLLSSGKGSRFAVPKYGSPARTTTPKT